MPKTSKAMKTDIILAGVGGQGILTIANVLGIAALSRNLYLKQAEVHGMSQRGGDVQSNLRLSSSPIHSDLIALGSADLIISMEPMEALRYLPYLRKGGAIVTNTVPVVNIPDYPAIETLTAALEATEAKAVLIDAEKVAREAGSPRSTNIALLGAASPFLPLEAEVIEASIAEHFAPKGEAVVQANIKAFKAGMALS